MAENTSSEANKGGNSIENIKKEVGLIGFIGGIIGIIVLIGAAAIFFLDYSKDQKNTDAQNEIFQAQYYYEQDSIELGLLGDGRNLGFLDIIDIYSGTEVANLASFYAGASYLKQRDYQSAVDYLSDFSTSEDILQARADKLLGDAYMELGNYSDAASNYESAAERVDDQYFSPGSLMSASLAPEKSGEFDAAIAALDKIIKDYKEAATNELNDARKHKARLEVLARK